LAVQKREELFLQSKCGIRQGFFDFSKEHIIASVDGILKRLQTEYLDALLLHRPDALVEPEEVAEAFDELSAKGKVRHFGVSNHKPMQIELLKRYVNQPLIINQLQFSIPVSNMVANGLEVNMTSDGAADYDGSILDYSRLHDMTIQAWSPFQMPNWQGCFIDNEKYAKLNEEMQVLAEQYGVSKTTIATAWILRHPAGMQVVTGTASEKRLAEIIEAEKVNLTRQEWYRLYLAAGHILP
jgi:predicted oxidoreductase